MASEADFPTPFEAEVKRWGNSLAVRIPKEVAVRMGLREGRKATFLALRRPSPRAFGARSDWREHPQRVKDRLREEHAR